jgi:zinc transport system permease protein
VDSLFAVPFFAGLMLALLLPLVGNLLRLRDEWLATLGLAHLAAAGALLGMALHLPTFAGALVGALAGACAKQASGGRSNSAYGLMILAGWALTLLVAANTALGEALAHALIDGQLYFAGWREFAVDVIVLFVALPLLRWLTPRLVAARLFPERERANGLPAWRWHLGFDLLVAVVVAAGTATFGLMASFALIFVPPWIAFRLGADWRRAQYLAAGIGVTGYGTAFWLALSLDQPFGPILVTVLALSFGVSSLVRRPASADFFRDANLGEKR